MPIHDRIPREVFETILHLCVGSETPVRDIVTLQLVCWSWHDIVAGASFLWGTITSQEGTPAFHKALRMAKNSPLDIVFSELGDIEAEDFFSLTEEKIDQWRSLDIQASRMKATFEIIRTTSRPPMLERLQVQDLGYTLEGADVVLFGGTPMTGLKHVELIGLSIDIPSLRLSGLKSLILQHIPSITAVEIIAIITNSPALNTLCLAQLEDAILPTEPATGEPNHSFHAPIQLHFLIKLKLADLSLHFLDFLLSNLAVPQLRFLDVVAEQPIPKLLAVDRRHLNATLTSVTRGAREYEIMLYSGHKIIIGGLCITFTPQSVLGSLAWRLGRMDDFEETFDRLSEHLAGLALADLPLHLTFQSCRPGLSDLEWFTRKANVTWLSFSSEPFRNDGGMDVIPLLSQPTSGPSSIWLLPQLEVFETNLASTKTQGQVVDMIKARHAALLDSSPGLHGAFPKQFKEIRLDSFVAYPVISCFEEFMTEVVQAVKGADVYWEGRKWTEWLSYSMSQSSQFNSL